VLFLVSALAATILPGSSEVALLALVAREPQHILALTATATVGNTLGASMNWCFGRWMVHCANRAWFPATPKRLDQATDLFRRYGTWLLLFSWVPIVGDPLTVIAGALRVALPIFVLLTGIGKLARYLILIGAWRGIQAM